VAFPAGSGTDALARFHAERLGRAWPAGDGGEPGRRLCRHRRPCRGPHGTTLFFGTVSTHTANPNLMREPSYGLIGDFASISLIPISVLGLLVRAVFPARDLAGFIAHAQARPEQLIAERGLDAGAQPGGGRRSAEPGDRGDRGSAEAQQFMRAMGIASMTGTPEERGA